MTVQPQMLRQVINWPAIQSGLTTWVQQATGLIPIWARLPGDAIQPPRPYAEIDLVSGPTPVGRDGMVWQYNGANTPAPPVGQEIAPVVFGMRRLGFQVKVYSGNSDPTTGLPDPVDLGDTAMSYISGLHASLTVPSVQSLLLSAGLAITSIGQAYNLPETEDSVWVSVAGLDIEFNTSSYSSTVDAGGYVNEIIGSGTEHDSNMSIPFDVKGPG